jgi:hypothetical protein
METSLCSTQQGRDLNAAVNLKREGAKDTRCGMRRESKRPWTTRKTGGSQQCGWEWEVQPKGGQASVNWQVLRGFLSPRSYLGVLPSVVAHPRFRKRKALPSWPRSCRSRTWFSSKHRRKRPLLLSLPGFEHRLAHSEFCLETHPSRARLPTYIAEQEVPFLTSVDLS